MCVLFIIATAGVHYEKPPCAADEALSTLGKYSVCAPACPKGKCPKDAPTGVTAKAECALSDPLGNKYCVLECTSDDECDTEGGAKCALVQPPKGICHYGKKDEAEAGALTLEPAYLTESYVQANLDELWAAFVQDHGRTYPDAAETAVRKRIFEESLLDAARWQQLNPLATYGVTPFSDWTEEEFKARRLKLQPANRTAAVTDIFSAAEVQQAPATVDWRTKGAVTAVKDQGDCGGCWAFATTGNIESVSAIAGNKLTELSEQELLDCVDYFPCMGCTSGEMSCAYAYLKSERKGEIDTETSYPYTAGGAGKTGKCKASSGGSGAKISGSKDLPTSESQMATWLASHGPIAIGAYALPWKQYKSGILTSCGSGAVDHAILVVGYGSEKGTDYWTLKNSWGTSFGEEGYIRVEKGKDLCKVASQPTTATVGKASVEEA